MAPLLAQELGAIHGFASTAISSAATNEARLHALAGVQAEERDRATEREVAEATRLRLEVRRIVRERGRGTPATPPKKTLRSVLNAPRVHTQQTVMQAVLAEEMTRQSHGLPKRTDAELNARAAELMGQTTAAQAASRAATVRSPFAPVPIIGTEKNKLIYDRELHFARRDLRNEEQHLDRLVRAQQEATGGFEDETPDIRRQRVRVASAKRELADLERLKELAPKTMGRAGSTQIRRRGGKVDVSATVVEQHRRGDTKKRLKGRITRARAADTAKEARILQNLEARTQIGIRQARATVSQQSVNALRDALARGEIRSRILHATGRGAVLGAGIGLTATGLGILAHHVIASLHRSRSPVHKIAGMAHLELAKAQRDTPESQMSLGLAMTFRRWIDRLLGRSEEPVDIGDGVAEAMAPGLTQAYAEGVTNPPIEPAPGYHIDFNFDVINPAVRRHMAEYALDRIVQISDLQRAAIRDALMQGSVMRGIGPIDVARTIRQSIGLTARQQTVVEGYRQGLQSLDPRVLERKLRDARYDRTVRRAIETNTPLTPEQVQVMTDAYHRRMLALRARTIARTEALRATSYGGLARAQQVLDENPGLEVTKRWLATDDERTRDTHRDLNGREVDGMTTQFITSKGNLIRWPLDENSVAEETINCRCTLQYIFKPKAGQLQAVSV